MAQQGSHTNSHGGHAFTHLNALEKEGVRVVSRRGVLKASLMGLGGLTVPELFRQQAEAKSAGRSSARKKSVILLWMSGGPSHIDTWDPKPERTWLNRGPFETIQTKLPGVFICEHLPKQAAMLDKFTIIRSVDCAKSSHEPNMVMQTGHRMAAPRTNPKGRMYPSLASLIAKFKGPNDASMPPYVAFNKGSSHIAGSGYLGKAYDPFQGNTVSAVPKYDLVGNFQGINKPAGVFKLLGNLSQKRVYDRSALSSSLDRLRSDIDQDGSMAALDFYNQQAIDMVIGQKAQNAFDISQESPETHAKYGKHGWCQKAMLARRLVEHGVNFVTIDLSYHTSSGTWDNHGDNIPPYGGISKGLGPLLPTFDHLITTLVTDLEERGILDDTLVVAMGEFGRSPTMGTQGSTDGRNHWPVVMSMCLAGGGFRHGQVIGASQKDGSRIKERPVTPGDLSATIFHHMGVPLETNYIDNRGRPIPIVQENGMPLTEII